MQRFVRSLCSINHEHILPQIFLRAWPFPRGAGRVIDHFFLDLRFQEEIARVRTSDGFYMEVKPNDLLGRHVYLTGEFDRTIVEILLRFASPNDVLLDIGANLGYVSACFLQNVSNSVAISIEPVPSLYETLRRNLTQFGGRAEPICCALSSSEGQGFMLVPDNPGASRLVKDGSSGAVAVSVRAADKFMSTLSRVDLIKVDVEGHEAEIFCAAKTELKRLQPKLIVFEDLTRNGGPDGSIGRVLVDIGYSVFGIRKRLTKLEYVPLHSAEDCRFNDYVAWRA
jgi:FkbM family methyltransferase